MRREVAELVNNHNPFSQKMIFQWQISRKKFWVGSPYLPKRISSMRSSPLSTSPSSMVYILMPTVWSDPGWSFALLTSPLRFLTLPFLHENSNGSDCHTLEGHPPSPHCHETMEPVVERPSRSHSAFERTATICWSQGQSWWCWPRLRPNRRNHVTWSAQPASRGGTRRRGRLMSPGDKCGMDTGLMELISSPILSLWGDRGC